MIVHCAGVAQSVERILGKDKVTGSIPVTSSIHGGIAQLARAIGSYPVCPAVQIRVPPPLNLTLVGIFISLHMTCYSKTLYIWYNNR